ncbi:MAG: pyridoxal phosphate-dependent decarboxylase family protein [Granulosicoccaceae bacterium]
MDNESFRQAGHQLIDWIADFRDSVPRRPVLAQVEPGEVNRNMPSLPDQPQTMETLLKALDEVVVPGVTQVQHPMHYGWFPSNASLASVLGDIACSGMGTLGISWESCPALTEVEEVTCDWMRQLTGLSEQWQGTIHDTASTACLVGILLARERASELCKNAEGLQSLDKPLRVYTTSQAHSSVAKAVQMAGIGDRNLVMVDVDPATQAMDPSALARCLADDLAAGLTPACVVGCVGSTAVTAFDPLEAIAGICEEHGVWLHVDAAMAGSAMLLPECRHLWQGVERADSMAWNPHKWLGTILDCSLFYVRDTDHLQQVLSTNPSYLRGSSDGQVTQYRDWGVPLGRRFRALKLWFHLALDGPDALRARLRRDLDNARWLAEQIEAHPDWELLTPLTLQTLAIRHNPSGELQGEALDQHTLRWVGQINDSGEAFLSPSLLGDRWMVRVSVGVESTEREHVEKLWALLQSRASNA